MFSVTECIQRNRGTPSSHDVTGRRAAGTDRWPSWLHIWWAAEALLGGQWPSLNYKPISPCARKLEDGDQSMGTRNLRLARQRGMALKCCHSSDYRQTLLQLGCEVSLTRLTAPNDGLFRKHVESSGGGATAGSGSLGKDLEGVESALTRCSCRVFWLRKSFLLSTPEIFIKHVGLHW